MQTPAFLQTTVGLPSIYNSLTGKTPLLPQLGWGGPHAKELLDRKLLTELADLTSQIATEIRESQTQMQS